MTDAQSTSNACPARALIKRYRFVLMVSILMNVAAGFFSCLHPTLLRTF